MKAFIALLLVVCFFSSCFHYEQGCTDADALNYDPKADIGDNLCCYKADLQGAVTLEDTDFDSPHFQDNVVLFELDQESYEPPTNDCPEAECAVFLKVHNLTSDQVNLQFLLESLGAIEDWTYIGNVVLEPNSILDLGKINTSCGYVTSILWVTALSLSYN